MRRRIPVVATLLVLAAVGVMIALGFWQLARMHEKDALLARYAMARTLSADVPFPRDAAAAEPVLYRHARIDCRQVVEQTAVSGQNAAGRPGQAQVAICRLPDGSRAKVVLGWSVSPVAPEWKGGVLGGIIAPGPRLVADPPVAGLEANARPDPADIPNNHLAYVVQWFFFAATALVIYALALRKRLKG